MTAPAVAGKMLQGRAMEVLDLVAFGCGVAGAGLLVAVTRVRCRTVRPVRHWLTM